MKAAIPTSNRPLLRIEDLRVEVNGHDGVREIVHGVNLTLPRGEVLGLIGESGAGKSTIGLAAMGYARAGSRISHGTIEFDGRDLRNAPDVELRKLRGSRIAYVAQSAAASLNPSRRIIDQYCEVPVSHRLMSWRSAEEKAKETYRQLLLPDPDTIGFRYPHQLSGGQLQRAMIAMALACSPDLIIFDEPTTALDVTTQVEVLSAIKTITEKYGTAALYVTHDLAVVAQIADQIMVLRNGCVVEQGRTEQIINRPQQDYTRRLLAVNLERSSEKAVEANEVPLLEANGITAGYGGFNILKDVGIKLYPHRTVAVVGESGSGKSTLARVLTGVLAPTQGYVALAGKRLGASVGQRPKSDLQRVQMVYQSPDTALNPQQTVGTILERPMKFYQGQAKTLRARRVEELLALVELPAAFKNRYPSALSGGEKQRVCLARALAADPQILICDEVTSALDPLVAQGVVGVLRRIQAKTGLAILFITHDLSTVGAIADQVVVMRGGRVVEHGLRDKVLGNPSEEYTSLLVRSVPKMDTGWLSSFIGSQNPQTI